MKDTFFHLKRNVGREKHFKKIEENDQKERRKSSDTFESEKKQTRMHIRMWK